LASSCRVHENQHAPFIGFTKGGIAALMLMQGTRDPDGIVLEELFEFLAGDMVRGKVGDIAVIPIEPHHLGIAQK